jgi:hypothetical protein
MFIAIAIHRHAPEHAEEFGDFMHRVRETEGRGDLGKEVGATRDAADRSHRQA